MGEEDSNVGPVFVIIASERSKLWVYIGCRLNVFVDVYGVPSGPHINKHPKYEPYCPRSFANFTLL
jgi:hypothetical protein